MGCFFSCFPIRNDDRRGPQFVSHTSDRFKSTQDVLVSKNRLSALFLAEEKEECESKVGNAKDCGSPQINKQIKDEVKFLKACGALQETPLEIRKRSKRFKDSLPVHKDSTESSKFHSWLVDSSTKIDQSPTLVSPTSCISNVHSSRRTCNADGDARNPDANQNESENRCEISKEFDSPGEQNISKDYPKPTPLKITEEMQTPGTYFPTNLGVVANGQTRMKKGDVEVETLKLEPGEESSVEDSTAEGSLSSWFKPKSEEDRKIPIVRNNTPSGKTLVDRPIIGMVAAHWNENEVSNISPKWWDGNGIPNSTNKYKEDQKVSWHATPFEERLEKALSEETLISQKKHINGTPIVFEEYEQTDTASSHLKASAHSQSVVSF